MLQGVSAKGLLLKESEMKDNSGIFGCIGTVVSFLLILIGGSIIGGWALSVLWNWFVSPVFDLPNLTIIQAIGISLITGYITSNPSQSSNDKDATEKMISNVVHAFAAPILYVGIGWVILQFM